MKLGAALGGSGAAADAELLKRAGCVAVRGGAGRGGRVRMLCAEELVVIHNGVHVVDPDGVPVAVEDNAAALVVRCPCPPAAAC